MDSGRNGGRPEHLAPVIPLFGDRDGPDDPGAWTSSERVAAGRAVAGRVIVERDSAEWDPAEWDPVERDSAEWDPAERDSAERDSAERDSAERATVERAAPTERAAASERGERSRPVEPGWHQTWLDDDVPPDDLDEERASLLHDAEQSLLKKLRTRSLSVREARAALVQAGLDHVEAETLADRFVRAQYLDDAALAEQLVHKATGRKGQGSRAIALSLARRGIPREVIDAALAELPDDDADRALEFARAKAEGMADLDREVALRRLAGQLARRGYGSVSLPAARRALDELPAARRTVRFD